VDHPESLKEFASQFKIRELFLSDRKFYNKLKYKLVIQLGNRYLETWHPIILLKDEEAKHRREGSTLQIYTNELFTVELICKCQQSPEANYKVESLWYSLDLQRNLRLRKERLPHNGCRFEIALKDRCGREAIDSIAYFIEDHKDSLSLTTDGERIIGASRAHRTGHQGGNIPNPIPYYRYNYGYGFSIFFRTEDIMQYFLLKFSDSVRSIYEYKLLTEIENAD
jgi:hypothetical protein